MKYFSVFLIISMALFLGCAHHSGGPDPKPTPHTTATPKPHVTPTANITAGIRDKMLYIGKRKALAIGLFDLMANVQTWPNEQSIDATARQVSDAGYNLARIWVRYFFKTGDLQPWVLEPSGDYNLQKLDPAFFTRMGLVSRVFARHGVQVAWTVWDGWSLRERDRFDAMNPDRHIDSGNPRLMDQIDWDTANPWCASRRFFKCKHDEGQPCQFGLDGFNSPVQWELLRRVCQVAKIHGNPVYWWSEMQTDPEHQEWDIAAFRYWIQKADTIGRQEHPSGIFGISVGDGQYSVYPMVQIADVHGLGINAGCNPGTIAATVAKIRAVSPNAAICINSDGCMSSPRQDATWLTDVGRKCYAAGAFPEFLSEFPIMPGLLQAGKNLSGK